MREAPTLASPTFRSRPFGHRQLRAGQIIGIGLITWLLPGVIGGIFALLAWALTSAGIDGPGVVLVSFGTLLLLSPFYGILAVPAALLLGAWAMRFGVAGWAVALGMSLVLPVTIGSLYQLLDPTAAAVGSMLVLTPLVVIHALVLWLATRLIAPHALLP